MSEYLFTSETVTEGHPDKIVRPGVGRDPRALIKDDRARASRARR